MMSCLDETDRKKVLHQVTRPDGVFALALSPNGQQLAFSTFDKDADASALHIMPLESGEPQTLLQLPRGEWIVRSTLVWTPDGNDILFVKRIFSEGEIKERTIWRVAAKGDSPPSSLGMGTRELPGGPVSSLLDLRIHRDGRVAFVAFRVSAGISVMENLLP